MQVFNTHAMGGIKRPPAILRQIVNTFFRDLMARINLPIHFWIADHAQHDYGLIAFANRRPQATLHDLSIGFMLKLVRQNLPLSHENAVDICGAA